MNRADWRNAPRTISRSRSTPGGMLLVALTAFQLELTSRVFMHTVYFYRVARPHHPAGAAARLPRHRLQMGRHCYHAVYSVFLLLIGHILPLFPADPKLGPVYQHVTQFVPPEFPLLLVVPAFALDLLWQRTPHWQVWRQVGCFGRRLPCGACRRSVAVCGFPA